MSVHLLSQMTFCSKGTCDFFLLCVVRLDVYLSVLLVETSVGTCCTDKVYLLCGFGDVYPGMTSVQMFYHTVGMDKVYLQCVCKNALLGLTLWQTLCCIRCICEVFFQYVAIFCENPDSTSARIVLHTGRTDKAFLLCGSACAALNSSCCWKYYHTDRTWQKFPNYPIPLHSQIQRMSTQNQRVSTLLYVAQSPRQLVVYF